MPGNTAYSHYFHNPLCTGPGMTGQKDQNREGRNPMATAESEIKIADVSASAAKNAAQRQRQTLEERLKLRQAQIAARPAKLASKRRAETIAKEARLDSLIGGACRADEGMHPRIRTALLRAVQCPKDREFLLTEGWLGEKVETRR
jgi:hypothetical protein